MYSTVQIPSRPRVRKPSTREAPLGPPPGPPPGRSGKGRGKVFAFPIDMSRYSKPKAQRTSSLKRRRVGGFFRAPLARENLICFLCAVDHYIQFCITNERSCFSSTVYCTVYCTVYRTVYFTVYGTVSAQYIVQFTVLYFIVYSTVSNS